jgi:uncharacterized protein with PIN domain
VREDRLKCNGKESTGTKKVKREQVDVRLKKEERSWGTVTLSNPHCGSFLWRGKPFDSVTPLSQSTSYEAGSGSGGTFFLAWAGF